MKRRITSLTLVLSLCIALLSCLLWWTLRQTYRHGTTAISALQQPVGDANGRQGQSDEPITTKIAETAAAPNADAQPVNAPTPLSSQPSLRENAILWVIGDEKQLREARTQMLSRIARLRTVEGANVDDAISTATAGVAALAKILDTTPMPYAPMNVGPPLQRPDGTPYPKQLIFSGMAPHAIKDPEQRRAYEEAIDNRDANNVLRGWLIRAQAAYRLAYGGLEDTLTALAKRGVISDEKRKSVLSSVQRQVDE